MSKVTPLDNGEHYALFQGIDPLEMSNRMHSIGLSLGDSTVEHGLIGYGDSSPVRIHSEVIYHEDMVPYFMLGCIKQASKGGVNILYNAVEAASIMSREVLELTNTKMVYHAEHYDDLSVSVPLIREKRNNQFLAFRQKKADLNEIHDLPHGWSDDDFYEYIDDVLSRTIEFEHLLLPGEVLLVDNYQTLHVRTAYEGLRKMIRVRVDDPESDRRYLA